jgi:hypothetical protein
LRICSRIKGSPPVRCPIVVSAFLLQFVSRLPADPPECVAICRRRQPLGPALHDGFGAVNFAPVTVASFGSSGRWHRKQAVARVRLVVERWLHLQRGRIHPSLFSSLIALALMCRSPSEILRWRMAAIQVPWREQSTRRARCSASPRSRLWAARNVTALSTRAAASSPSPSADARRSRTGRTPDHR